MCDRPASTSRIRFLVAPIGVVSQEDRWRLERTGAFEGLEPVPNLTTSGEPPPPPKPDRPPGRP
jgi:hypothetical protein